MRNDMQRVALTAQVTAEDIDHKVPAMSLTIHDCTALFESEQLVHFEVKCEVISGR